jgi:hypothetical protein
VLLPSDTHRKPITSITVVLLQFVTHLLISLVKDGIGGECGVFFFLMVSLYCNGFVQSIAKQQLAKHLATEQFNNRSVVTVSKQRNNTMFSMDTCRGVILKTAVQRGVK